MIIKFEKKIFREEKLRKWVGELTLILPYIPKMYRDKNTYSV